MVCLQMKSCTITILRARVSSKTILVTILLFWSQSGISTGFSVDFSELLHQAPKNPSGFCRPGLYILVFITIPAYFTLFCWGLGLAHAAPDLCAEGWVSWPCLSQTLVLGAGPSWPCLFQSLLLGAGCSACLLRSVMPSSSSA